MREDFPDIVQNQAKIKDVFGNEKTIKLNNFLGEHTSDFYLKILREKKGNPNLQIKDLPEPLQEFMYRNESLYPIVQLKDLWMQIPSLKKKYLKFENYA